MSSTRERIQVLYEISLAIGRGNTLEETADRALTAYLQKLNCSVGGIFERRERDDGVHYDPVVTIPSEGTDDELFRSALEWFPGRGNDTRRTREDGAGDDDGIDDETFREALPITARAGSSSRYYVMELPGFGVLLLGKRRSDIGDEILTALEPLNEKLAEACHNRRVETKLREERNRFETVFETIEEPLVQVAFEDGNPLVQRVNRAFEQTFGYEEEVVRGNDLNDFILPDDPAAREQARQMDECAERGETVTREVRRQTVDGVGDFLFRTAPVGMAGINEHFGLYVDITEEKNRRRKLERLYEETESILAGRGREEICQRTVRAAAKVIDLSVAGIHLYDRQQEALVPVATTGTATDVFGGDSDAYTEGSIVWEAYDNDEPTRIDDLNELEDDHGLSPVRSIVVLPLGDHGVFFVSSLEPNALDDVDFQFTRLLSTPVEAALDRAMREEGLAEIQDIVRTTLDADSQEDVAKRVIERLPEVLDLPISAIWKYNPGKGALEPLAATDAHTRLFGEEPTFTGGDSIAWTVFERGETAVVSDTASRPDTYYEDSPIGSEIITPIGEFGVLATGSTRVSSFTESERQLVETLASNVETVMRLVSRRQELQLLDQVLARILRHNLRNDLTVIQGFATTIEQACDGEPARQAERIIRRCERLETTAEHAREMRKIVRSSDETVSVSLGNAVEHAVSVVEDDYPGAEITVDLEVSPEIIAHPEVATAIRHLVENGIEHNGSGRGSGRVDISVFGTDDEVVVEISDDGPGIPEDEIEILERQGESSLEHGSGTGLWIVDRVVEYSDASLEFEVSDGTTAIIRFDL